MHLKKIQHPILTCEKISYGFFSRLGGFSTKPYKSLNCSFNNNDNKNNVIKNINIVKEDLNLKKIIKLNQIHSSEVVIIEKLNDISDFYNVDSIVTKIPGIGLSILGADCAPILFYDKIEKIIAACHAGWRGAVDNIVEKTIHKMESIGAKRNQISAVIGPAIQKNSYEIGQEVADIIQNCSFFSNKIPILSYKINDKFLFNLPLFLQQCLKNSEIINIGNVELDTYTNPHLFFSHRRSSHKNMNETGRQISVIGILE